MFEAKYYRAESILRLLLFHWMRIEFHNADFIKSTLQFHPYCCRGILQFENVSYGIEPLESTIALQHIIYKLGNEENKLTIFNKNSRNMEMPTNYGIFINEKVSFVYVNHFQSTC